jgi:two-component system, OmpR family, response regulator VicR
MKVLIAEDDPLTSKAIEHRLMLDNYEIHTAFNGNRAIEMLKREDFDLLLVDIHMPFKGGLEVIEYVRHALNKTVPIAVVSRIGISETVHKAFEMGADEYITKPFDPDDLSKKIKQMLSKA